MPASATLMTFVAEKLEQPATKLVKMMFENLREILKTDILTYLYGAPRPN